MSSNGQPRSQPYLNGRDTPPQAGDELGAYTHEQVIKMDRDFVAAVERAISRGLERRPEERKARAA